MKKSITLAIIIGILVPFFSNVRAFYYISVFFVAALLFISFKRGSLNLIDLLILVIITIPLHTFRFGGEENFIRLSEIAFIPLFLLWFFVRLFNKHDKPFIIRKEFLFLFIYLLINLASLKNSILPIISIKRILILAYLFLFTYIVSDTVNNKRKIEIIIKSMILISAFSAIIAALQSVFPQLLIFSQVPIGKFLGITFYRVGVGWHDPNYYALYLGMNASLTLSYILSFSVRSTLLKVCFILQICGLFFTFSRTVIISLIIVIMYVLYYFGKKRSFFVLLMTFLLIMSTLAFSMVTVYKNNPFLASMVYRVADKEKAVKQPILIMGHRFAAFKANWNMFLDHPLLGVGPFMAIYNFEKYRPREYESPTPLLASHNQYLQLLSEKGIFGFICFIGFILVILKRIKAKINSPISLEYKTFLVGLKTSIFVYLLSSLSLETSHEMQFWLTIGIVMAIFNNIKKEYADK